jgi:hypothetical protein
MRYIFPGFALLFALSSAYALDQPIPISTDVEHLPAGARLVIKKSLKLKDFNRNNKQYYENHDLKVVSNTDGRDFDWLGISCKNEVIFEYDSASPIRFNLGRTRRIDLNMQAANGYNYIGHFLEIHFSTDEKNPSADCEIDLNTADLVKNSGDLMRNLSPYFDLVNEADPYAGMDKGVIVDVAISKITSNLKAGQPAKALPEFQYLEKLGVPLPESFYFYYTDTLSKLGKNSEALAHAQEYLKSYGKKGKYYSQVVEIMGRL